MVTDFVSDTLTFDNLFISCLKKDSINEFTLLAFSSAIGFHFPEIRGNWQIKSEYALLNFIVYSIEKLNIVFCSIEKIGIFHKNYKMIKVINPQEIT